MTTNEYAQFILQAKKEAALLQAVDETAAYEAAQLLSGSFTYLLYEALWMNNFDMDTITKHLNNLHDSENHFGSIYFIFILANTIQPHEGALHHNEGVDLIPSSIELSSMEMTLVNAMSREFTLRTYVNEVKNDYDYVLIDCMPSLGMITINALAAADSVIIPVQAHYLPANGLPPPAIRHSDGTIYLMCPRCGKAAMCHSL